MIYVEDLNGVSPVISAQAAAECAERVISYLVNDWGDLRPLEYAIIRVLALFFSEDSLYEQANRLNGDSTFGVLAWLNKLDFSLLSRVANELNMPVSDLETTIKTMNQFNYEY